MNDASELWAKAMEGESPHDESIEITSSDVNRQSAERWAALSDASERVGKRYAHLHQMRQDEMQAQAWEACAAEAQKCGLLLAEDAGILANRNPYRASRDAASRA